MYCCTHTEVDRGQRPTNAVIKALCTHGVEFDNEEQDKDDAAEDPSDSFVPPPAVSGSEEDN